MKAIKNIAVLAICLLLVLSALPLAAKGVKDIKYPNLNEIDVPLPDKVVLDNGMAIYFLEDHSLPKVNISVRINKCGEYLEPANMIGLASMTGEVMRTGGTTTMTGDQIDEELEAIGAYVETGIGEVSGSAAANALSEFSETIVKILADVLRNPVFDEDKIVLARTNQKSGISRRNDEPIPIAVREFQKLVYGADSPYARHTEYATIDAVTRNDMIMFHKMAVQAKNVQMAVWGDFTKDEMLALIKKYFTDWARGETELPLPPDVDYTFRPTVNLAEKSDINQTTIIMGHIGGKMGDPDYAATIVMNSILGEGFGSRLFRNLRTKMGLAYAAGGSFTFDYDHHGYFISYIITKSETTAKAIRAMLEQIKSMQTELASEEEMKLGKDGWLNSYVFNFDTKSEVLGRMMTYDYYGMPTDYLQKLKEQVENITAEDVRDIAIKKLDPDNLQILAVGKSEDFDEPLSVFGQVNEIDITIPTPDAGEFAATDEELLKGLTTLSKVVDACGGVDNFKKVKSISTSAAVTITTPQGAMTIDVSSTELYPEKSIQIISTPMGVQTMVYSGDVGWTIVGEKTTPMPEAQLKDRGDAVARDMVRIFSAVETPGFKVAHKGEEEFAGKTAIRLEFLLAGDVQETMFVDPASFMPTGVRHLGQTPMGPGEIVDIYKEFMDASGTRQPKLTDRDVGGMAMEIDITKIVINGDIDETIFDRPDGI